MRLKNNVFLVSSGVVPFTGETDTRVEVQVGQVIEVATGGVSKCSYLKSGNQDPSSVYINISLNGTVGFFSNPNRTV